MRAVRIYHAGRDAMHRERDRALVRAGVDLTLVVPADWPGPDDVHEEPFEIVELPVHRPGDVNRHRYADPAAVVDVIARRNPDVVDVHEEPFSRVVHDLLRGVPSTQPIVSYAAQNIDKRFPPPFAGWEERALGRIRGAYPCSRQAASVLAGKGFTGELRVLPLGLPPALAPGTQQLPDDVLRLLFVGRLVPEKGALDAIRVLAALDGSAQLTIAGRGPQAAAASALGAELGVPVDVADWLGTEELAQRYRTAHVLLAPSRATRTWVEQFGRMATEAQAAGAVVVGYASGSLPEVVGDTGVLVAEGDEAALGDAVAALRADPDRWRRLRSAGLAASAERSWDAIAAGQLALYEAARAVDPVRRVRPRRAAASAEWGEPARIAGGGRPFAVPVLRDDRPLSRALATALDARERDSGPPPGRIRVVYVDHVAILSGGELALARLLTALPNVDAHVILGEDGPLRQTLERAGATVEVLPLDPGARDARRHSLGAGAAALTARYTLRLARRLRDLRPHLVHTNSLKSGYYGGVAARLAGVPQVWHLRDRIVEDYLPPRAVALTRQALRRLPALVVANSTATLATAGDGLRAAAVLPSPVELDAHPVAQRADGRFVVGIVGRLAAWKGQDVLLRATSRLPADTHVRIVGSAMFGEDDFEHRLRALVGELGLAGRVEFTGFVADVPAELARLDVLVHASVTPEPFGQVVVEGMAARLPVVATDAGGPAEIVTDGVDGLLVPPGDEAALGSALQLLRADAELRNRLGAAGQVRARDFAPQVVGERLEALYRGLLG